MYRGRVPFRYGLPGTSGLHFRVQANENTADFELEKDSERYEPDESAAIGVLTSWCRGLILRVVFSQMGLVGIHEPLFLERAKL